MLNVVFDIMLMAAVYLADYKSECRDPSPLKPAAQDGR